MEKSVRLRPPRFCRRCSAGLHDRNHSSPMGCLTPVGSTDQDSYICTCLLTPAEVQARTAERVEAGVSPE